MRFRSPFAIFGAIFVSACAAQSLPETAPIPKLDVRLTVTHSTYKTGEPIEVTAFIRNGGEEPFYVWKGIGFGYYGEGIFVLHLVDSAGHDVPEKYRAGGHRYQCGTTDFAECVAKDWLLLAPGEIYGVTQMQFTDGLQPGTYSLSVKYQSSAFPFLTAGQKTMKEMEESSRKLKYAVILGTFQSTPVSFQVLK
jgi:hypothetical protein